MQPAGGPSKVPEFERKENAEARKNKPIESLPDPIITRILTPDCAPNP